MNRPVTPPPMGISGRLAAAFQDSPLTPLLALTALLLGLFAVTITPREEEPQIDVTMANVFVPWPGAPVADVVQRIAVPLEQVLSAIEGVEHVYTVSRPGMAVATVQYEVGVARRDAILRLQNQVFSHADWLPQGLGVGTPLIRPMGIDDVPVLALTLYAEDPELDALELAEIAHALEHELARVPGTRDVYTLGAPQRVVEVELDGPTLARHGLSVAELAQIIAASNRAAEAGALLREDRLLGVTTGSLLTRADELAALPVGRSGGRALALGDFATVRVGAEQPRQWVWHASAAHPPQDGGRVAVTLAIAKQPGANAADVTRELLTRVEQLRGVLIPDAIGISISRDYGATADDKARTLMTKLAFATFSVVLLVLAALGWREALVVGIAVILTLALTLFASWVWGFTLNRVSLFALIFSIGILVDDAIVVVENIHRHMARGGSLLEIIPGAVDEVGGPTILATFTVIAALMPMAFVTGLMGPYMSPIPINASTGMLISLAIALVVTPWLALKLLRRHGHAAGSGEGDGHGEDAGRLLPFFERLMRPFLAGQGAGLKRGLLFGAMVLLVGLALGLVAIQAVVLKMLPFDNKSEFQVVVDLPEGSPLERTQALLIELAAETLKLPEVRDVQAYAGTAAPINFNGLVRQYYLRAEPHMGDLQVNLVDRRERRRKSHEIAANLRPLLAPIAARHGASVKVVEVPPGPPVLAPIVAEVYGPDAASREATARVLLERFLSTPDVVDVDSTLEADPGRLKLVVDRERAARLGVVQADVVQTLAASLSGYDASFLFDGGKYAVPIRLRLPVAAQDDPAPLLDLPVRSASGALVPLSELAHWVETSREASVHHKNGLPVHYVTGDLAGRLDSPLYGLFTMAAALAREPDAPRQHFFAQPALDALPAIKWDGEWEVTWKTFRDMGIAYAAGLVLIYLLVVAQFRSYLTPLVIMAPIPLTVVGVMPGHALLGAQFTATSMIGMIALAGIIVRNSILLVDFIDQELAEGRPLETAVIHAAAVRAKPIALTAIAAMLGAGFILDDPIFNGLAISLIFGIFVSTVLTLVVIPLLYYVQRRWMARPVAS